MSYRISRRGLVIGSATALGTMSLGGRVFAQDSGPIRIGLLAPITGFAPDLGRDVKIGAEIAVEQLNKAGGVMGRPVELIVRDDKINPNETVAAMRELSGLGVKLFTGGVFTATALAAFGILQSIDGLFMTLHANGDSLTHENFNPLGFRLNENAAIRGRAAGRLAAQRYPKVRHWSGITTDNEAGASQWRAFAAGIKRYYPEIAGEEPVITDVIKVKVGANDFKNEIAQIMAGPVEGLMLSFPDPATLVQQARPFGWERKIKVFMDMGNDVVLANALGKRTPPNFWTASDWYSGAYVDRIPAAKRLYDDYVARTGDDRPSGYVGISHAAIDVYVQAIAKAGTASSKAVAKALEENTFDTVGGKRSFRSDHQATGDSNFYNFVASDTDRRGWSIAQFVAEDNASVAPPPTPGIKLTE
ncbi:ABC transporter substrate-binding protein [Microvirga subterranea]|uniref:Branched-chain amino acid transport system substrate-binding protein n=1 Tax=Microvirga subterranea TaxID=186651 RepID=A0A370HA63_9HYPH|nr:ABC transporter substrate-binding protein [Microvirga subterranea]RDI53836.1 branched-chain amino acid transport system substrate-binding protein [Microvirga subterranea]